MVAKTLLPQAFWFRFAAPCMRVDGIPRANFSSGLLALPPSCALPDLKPLDGGARWAEVRVGWNSGGLGIAVLADGVTAQQLADRRPEGFAVAQFWVDTRDTRNVSRATKFCHRFVARIDRGSSRGRLDCAGRPACHLVQLPMHPSAGPTTSPCGSSSAARAGSSNCSCRARH